MKAEQREKTAMLVSLLLCLGVLLGAAFMNWALSKKPAFYINLRDFPIYGREGFIPDATPLPGAEKAPPWKQISPAGDSELVVVKEKFNVPRLAFLSPFGQSPREYTYRIVFNLPSERYDEFWGDKTITPAIHIPAIGDNWEVYLNGTLVRSEVHLDGSGEITSHRAQRKVRFPFDNELFHSGDNVIDFRIIGDPAHENLGFFYGIPLFISEFSYVDRSSGEYLPIAIIGIYFFIGLYHFLLFMMRPGDRYNLFYSLFSIVLGIYFFSRTSVIYRISPDTNLWVRIELASVFMIFPLLSAFFDELTHQRLKLPTKIYGALSIALSLAECIFSPQFGEDALILWLPTIAGWIVYIFAYYFGYTFFYSVRQEWKKRRAAGENRSLLREYLHQIGSSPLGNIMIGLLLVFFTGGFDIIDSIFLNIGFLTSLYGFMVFNLGIAFILARRFGELYNQLNLANITLEGTVKERTKALEEQTLIAVSASNAKSDFLANMSHEIRTPLNAILGFSELTLLEPRDSKIHTNLQNIHNSATHLLGLINDILDISKIESGKLELHPGEYDLVSLLNDAIALNTVRIGDRPVAFHLELDETLPSRLYGDVLRLRQILNNLLSNAIKFTREGEVRFSVFRGAGDAPPGEICLCFEVRDTGVGIKEEDRGKIFSRFNQASSKDGSIIEGTGLGLDISRQLAELMNGGISLESEYGKGSVFTVTVRQGIIRQAKPVGREIAAVLENLTFLNRHLLQMNFKRVQMPGVRVLVVDDVPSNLEVAGAFLSLYGMKVDTAGGGEEAINILREKPELYDLVFLDHMMPGVNGPAVLKALREDIGGLYAGSLPVIALSANALVGSGEMFMKMGFQDFISKPINAFALDQVLKKWLPEHKIEGPAEPEAEANDPPSSAAVSPSASGNAAQENPGVSIFSIEGINTSMGYRNSGCDDESYHYMLDSFCRDSEEKVSALRHLMYYIQSVEDYDNINENTAALLETMLRIMKNSALSIGAEDAAAEAAVLEEKAKTGDIKGLLSALPAFYLNIQSAADRIREKLIS